MPGPEVDLATYLDRLIYPNDLDTLFKDLHTFTFRVEGRVDRHTTAQDGCLRSRSIHP